MTRVQRERFFNEEDYLRLKDSYILTPDKLQNAKVDDDAVLNRINGHNVSPSLLDAQQLHDERHTDIPPVPHLPENPRCITSVEQELPQEFKLTDRERRIYRCLYCETQAGK